MKTSERKLIQAGLLLPSTCLVYLHILQAEVKFAHPRIECGPNYVSGHANLCFKESNVFIGFCIDSEGCDNLQVCT